MADVTINGQVIRVAERAKYPASEVALANGQTVEANNSAEDAAESALDARLDIVETNETTRARKRGMIPSARLVFTGNAVDTKTITVDGEVWTSVAGAPTGKQFQIGGDAAASIDALLARFNSGANKTAKNLVADRVGTDTLRFRLADAPGGTPTPGTTSMAVSTNQDNATVNVANINETGQTQGIGVQAYKRIAMTTLNVAGIIAVELPFTPVTHQVQLNSSAGAPKAWTGTVTYSGTTVLITPGAGGSPAIDGDLLDLVVFGNQT